MAAAGTLRLVLGDQLSPGISSLVGLEPERDTVLLAEVADETQYVRHHKKKIAFVFSAMRHFAAALAAGGVRVEYVKLDDAGNTGSLRGELARAVQRFAPREVVVTEPGEWRLLADLRDWAEGAGLPVHLRDDTRFFCSRAAFARWAGGKRQLRMELFYRSMRQRHAILMEPDGTPTGGQWNFDKENRKRLPDDLVVPPPRTFEPDAITTEVLDLVRRRFAGHFGDLDPFRMAVTPADAETVLDHFLEHALPLFGDYQDAMRHGEPALFHSLLAAYLNIGLLDARTVCERVAAEGAAGRAPLNAVEGYIRQILGWREYVRGIYWLKMPGYAATNRLDAHRPLPAFYWTGETDLACLAEAIGQTKRNAYAHHIQRLMVSGNFALLAGLAPAEVNYWYLVVYADAYEWVQLPNTHGMVLYADGGFLASKPYAASGAYINRMSDHCRHCPKSPHLKAGAGACPFNYLYWNFLLENQERLRMNPRLAMPYRTLARMPPERIAEIRADSAAFLDALVPAERGTW